jgi:hypothetical protein
VLRIFVVDIRDFTPEHCYEAIEPCILGLWEITLWWKMCANPDAASGPYSSTGDVRV